MGAYRPPNQPQADGEHDRERVQLAPLQAGAQDGQAGDRGRRTEEPSV